MSATDFIGGGGGHPAYPSIPQFFPLRSLDFVSNAYGSSVLGAAAGTANVVEIAPFSFARDVTVNRMEAVVSTAAAAGVFHILLFEAEQTTGAPGATIRSVLNQSSATTGAKGAAITNFTFLAGCLYWAGIHSGATAPTIRRLSANDALILASQTVVATAPFVSLRATVVYNALAAPTLPAFNTMTRSIVSPPYVRFQAI